MLRRNLWMAFAILGGLAGSLPARAGEPAALPPATKPAVEIAPDAYRAASPYNVTVVGRVAPNPQYNRQNFTLPCDNPRQNLESLIFFRPGCIKKLPTKCSGCGCRGEVDGGLGVGNCATCSNTYNFVWAGSRSFFGESSREFFERPPAVDAVRHKWNPLPVLYRTETAK
jgi:hypothetical protein